MCGIAGAVDPDERRAELRVRVLNDRQSHRGPDHSALVRAGSFTLGNTRLAIQDPSPVGNQPFRSADGRFVCVFNGEIYNYRELIRQHQLELPSQCDGAIIPELWARFGESCLRSFRGMYAIAIADTVDDTLTICRDPFGIKPLYYRQLDDHTLLFGSEVKPLAAVTPAPSLSQAAIAAFLHLGSLPADISPYEGVVAVAPNTAVRFSRDGTHSSWSILPGAHPLTEPVQGEVSGTLAETLVSSIDLHLRSDVPSALLLSSGVDSAAIAAGAHRLGKRLHCLTVAGFGAANEVAGASITAARYGHDHQVVEAGITANDVESYFQAMQRPSVDGLNTFIVCRAVARAGYRVALSGLGGDEALGGYPHYRLLPWLGPLRLFDRLPEALWRRGSRFVRGRRRQKLWRLVHPHGPRTAVALDLLQRELFPAAAVEALTGVVIRPPLVEDEDARSFRALVEAEFRHYMQPTLLADADAFSMCSSVELRVPLVDHPLVTSAVSPRAAAHRAPGKRSLADALDDDYLRELVGQPKRGFTVPVADWLKQGPLEAWSRSLGDRSAPVWDVVDFSTAARVLGERAADRWQERWALAALNGWLLSLDQESMARSER